MTKPYRIKWEVFQDERLDLWDPEDLDCFNWLNVYGENVAEELDPDVPAYEVPRG